MNQSEMYQKLVDMYAGNELPEELMEELETAAFGDAELAREMRSLRVTVNALKAVQTPPFGEETFHRILFKLYAAGADPEIHSPSPALLQYQLPMSG